MLNPVKIIRELDFVRLSGTAGEKEAVNDLLPGGTREGAGGGCRGPVENKSDQID